jgi:hypothetical protein
MKILVITFICLFIYYVYRFKNINDLEFYILVLSFIIILLSLKRIEKFTGDNNEKYVCGENKLSNIIDKYSNKYNKYIDKYDIKSKINILKKNIKEKITDNSIQINKLFSLIKQKLNGYQI